MSLFSDACNETVLVLTDRCDIDSYRAFSVRVLDDKLVAEVAEDETGQPAGITEYQGSLVLSRPPRNLELVVAAGAHKDDNVMVPDVRFGQRAIPQIDIDVWIEIRELAGRSRGSIVTSLDVVLVEEEARGEVGPLRV